MPPKRFIVFCENHDQVGNRAFGERLSCLASFEGLKLAGAAVVFSGYIPLLFMGQEYAEDSPFLYFVSHSDKGLIEAVKEGRKKEFSSFKWDREPPDPQDEKTFLDSRLDWQKRFLGKHKVMLDFYKEMLKLRKEDPCLSVLERRDVDLKLLCKERVILMQRTAGADAASVFMNFDKKELAVPAGIFEGAWNKVFDSSATEWNGPGEVSSAQLSGEKGLILNPLSLVIYKKEKNL